MDADKVRLSEGLFQLYVPDGARLTQLDQRDARAPQPRTVDQLIRTLNKGRRNDTLYVRLLSADPGAVVNGEVLTSLPPSVLAVVEGDHSSGTASAVNSATLGEWEAQTGHVISGLRALAITVSPN